jgi:seryl-tRNA synthetase
MIDIQDLRKRPEAYQVACDKKRIKFSVNEFLELDAKVRALKASSEKLRSEQNAFSKEVPKLSGDAKSQALEKMKLLSADLKEQQNSLKELEDDFLKAQYIIPSIPLECVPLGKDDTENVEVKVWGEKPSFKFTPKDHVELALALGMVDFERGVKIAGSRNYFLLGDGARLHHAVLQFAKDFITDKKFTLVDPPHLVRYDAMSGTGYFPGGEDQAYHLDVRDDDTYLIGTSEVSVCAMMMKENLEKSQLPLRYAGYSPCYRREAGTYGKDTAGLYRIHQFYKVEQVVICEANDQVSASLHQEILNNAESLLQALELPYRVVDVCTGDMGRGQVYKNDVETWMPSRNAYGETHSCSTMHDFQARRLNLRYRDDSGELVYCHTLNNTLIASPRVLIPIIENNQQADGSIVIPKVLRPYMKGQEIIKA